MLFRYAPTLGVLSFTLSDISTKRKNVGEGVSEMDMKEQLYVEKVDKIQYVCDKLLDVIDLRDLIRNDVRTHMK